MAGVCSAVQVGMDISGMIADVDKLEQKFPAIMWSKL